MPTLEQDRSRRRGRMELLLADLNGLPAGYKPDIHEAALARSLWCRLASVYGMTPEFQKAPQADPGPGKILGAEEQEQPQIIYPAPKQKTENRKQKTGSG